MSGYSFLSSRLRLSLALAAILAASAAFGAGCDREEDAVEYRLTFEDEFEGPAGELPDTNAWHFDEGTGWGNNQLEWDTASSNNIYLDGYGHLAITAREEELNGCEYTSGRINTFGSFDQERGRFEARIKLPVGSGIWPAFWLLGSNIYYGVDWPYCGEIDIMEYRGQEPNVLHGSLHGPGYSGGSAITRRLELDGPGLNEGYHVYAIDWDSGKIMWMIDGTPYHTVTPSDLPPESDWVFDHPFHILLNVAVGGTFVGTPGEDTVFPQTMLVDWVRVYSAD